jgi:hypothetical protein
MAEKQPHGSIYANAWFAIALSFLRAMTFFNDNTNKYGPTEEE